MMILCTWYYIGLDVHSRTCTMAWITMTWMNEEGAYRGPSTFRTDGENLRKKAEGVKADEKALTLEEGPLAFWTARVLDGIVDRTVVCDPRENYLISRAARKDDEADAKALARLLRLGEVKEVYQPENDRRALFKQAASHYCQPLHGPPRSAARTEAKDQVLAEALGALEDPFNRCVQQKRSGGLPGEAQARKNPHAGREFVSAS
jgi:hypothetical protein